MLEHHGPREIIDRATELLLAHDMAGFANLWAVDGTLEIPFAPDGYPQRIEGRAAIAEYLGDYTDHFDVRAIADRTVHQTVDPEVVVLEFEVEGVAVRTERPYRARYICVVTVHDGEIVVFRDYWNPLTAAEVLGGADELSSFGAAGGPR